MSKWHCLECLISYKVLEYNKLWLLKNGTIVAYSIPYYLKRFKDFKNKKNKKSLDKNNQIVSIRERGKKNKKY